MMKELQNRLSYVNFYCCNYDHFPQWLNFPYVSLGKVVEGNLLPSFDNSAVMPFLASKGRVVAPVPSHWKKVRELLHQTCKIAHSAQR